MPHKYLEAESRAMKDKTVAKRFEEELIARGIKEHGPISWKDASQAAKWTSGRRAGKKLGDTYIRDVIRTGRGAFECIELLCNAHGLDWNYVKTGKRTVRPPTEGELAEVHRVYEDETLGIDELLHLIESALMVFGASKQDAAVIAGNVVKTWRAR